MTVSTKAVKHTPDHILTTDDRRAIFTIQIAAVSQIGDKFNQIKSSLSDVGEVYKVFYHNMIKIRVGQFTEEQSARDKLNVVKQRGYKDAFVVREELIRDESSSTKTEVITTPAPSTSKPVVKEESQTSILKETTKVKEEVPAHIPEKVYDERLTDLPKYRIKLGSYTNFNSFDGSAVRKLGTIVTEEKDEWTIVYLGDYLTIEDAEAIRIESVRKGFKSACIYGVRNGELIKIN